MKFITLIIITDFIVYVCLNAGIVGARYLAKLNVGSLNVHTQIVWGGILIQADS